APEIAPDARLPPKLSPKTPENENTREDIMTPSFTPDVRSGIPRIAETKTLVGKTMRKKRRKHGNP
ncbi:hypothetical protein DF186_21965, partial [Enterococcus hirae]